jgi:hypothetical protein
MTEQPVELVSFKEPEVFLGLGYSLVIADDHGQWWEFLAHSGDERRSVAALTTGLTGGQITNRNDKST